MIDISTEGLRLVTESMVARAAVQIATAVQPHAERLSSKAEAGADRVTITGPGVSDEYNGRPWIIAAVAGA